MDAACRRGYVAGRRPSMKRPQTGQNREADEDQREGPHLKVRGEGKSGEVAERHGFSASDDVRGDQANQHIALPMKEKSTSFMAPYSRRVEPQMAIRKDLGMMTIS